MTHLWKQEGGWLIHYSVDVKDWRIENYYTIVKTQMDFTIFKYKLSNNKYKFVVEFV